MSLRVCFVTQTFPDWTGSPRGEFIRELAAALVERGVDVAVVAPRVFPGSRLVETMGRPLVTSAHGTDLLVWGRGRGVVSRLTSLVLRRSPWCTVNSPAMLDVAVACGMKRDRAVVVRETGVDLHVFSADRDGSHIRRRHGIDPDAVLVLGVAHLTPVKRPEWLLQAFAKVKATCPRAHLMIVGDGPSLAAVQQLARSLGVEDRVTLPGFVVHDAIPPYFAAADVFAHAAEDEALGIVIMEAMASGRPVVATRVGGIPSLVEDGSTGLLFEPDDLEGLTSALTRLCEDGRLAKRMGERARKRAETEFRRDTQVERVLAVYNQALTTHRRVALAAASVFPSSTRVHSNPT